VYYNGCYNVIFRPFFNQEAIAMTTLKLTQIGNSLGVILPKELLAKLKVSKGDEIFVTESPAGITLSGYDPSFEEQLELGRDFMREYRDTFKVLAK